MRRRRAFHKSGGQAGTAIEPDLPPAALGFIEGPKSGPGLDGWIAAARARELIDSKALDVRAGIARSPDGVGFARTQENRRRQGGARQGPDQVS